MKLDKIHEGLIKSAIEQLNFNSFQDFVNFLMLEKYGNDLVAFMNSFICVRQKKDRGCDGILENKTILAVYAPERNPDLKKFKKKVEEDYEKYKNNWKIEYPNFCFVYNGEYTANMIQIIDKLDRNIGKYDINTLLKIIKQMGWTNVRNISSYLGVDEQIFKYDILKNVVDDMMNDNHETRNFENKKPSYIEDKIKLNYDDDDVEGALNQYFECFDHLNMLKSVLKPYNDSEISSLKSKIMIEYEKYSGRFKTRLNYLNDFFAGKNQDDDLYKFYVRVVLIYAFEICIIGKRTSEERC